MTATIVNAAQKPTQPQITQTLTKKGREERVHLTSPYGCFLRIKAIIAMQITIAMKRPAIAGMKYRSAAEGDAVACGVAVAAGSAA